MTKILEKIKAEIYKKSVQMHFDGNFYIKMDEVLQLLDKYAEQEPNSDIRLNRVKNELNQVKNELKSKTGHWIRITNGAMKEKYICSECCRQIEDDGIECLLPIKYPYCHCGAKMVKPQESEE